MPRRAVNLLSNRYNPQKDRKSPPGFSVKSLQSSKRQIISARFFCQIFKTTQKTENFRPVFLSNQQNHYNDRKPSPVFSVKSAKPLQGQKISARFFCQISKTTTKTENFRPVFLSNRSNPQKDRKSPPETSVKSQQSSKRQKTRNKRACILRSKICIMQESVE